MSDTTTPDVTSTIRERIEKGAAWLARVKPEWRTLIDTESLDMRAGDACVLGQVFATEAKENNLSNGYSHAYHVAAEVSAWWAIDHGFESGGEDYWDLRAHWLRFLAEEEETRGCSCGMADHGAPGHDGGPAL